MTTVNPAFSRATSTRIEAQATKDLERYLGGAKRLFCQLGLTARAAPTGTTCDSRNFSEFSERPKCSNLHRSAAANEGTSKTSQSDVQAKPKEAHETEQSRERSWRGLYRLGGVLLIATAVLWFALSRMGVVLYASGMPSNPTAYLQLISQNQALAAATWSIWDIADFLLIVPTVALYLVLRRYNKTLALLGAVLQGFFIFYDISVTELNLLTLVSLSQSYASAASDALRISYVAAATYGYAALPLQTVLSFGIGTFGFLLWCIPMAKGVFRRPTAIFGAIVNAIGVVESAAPVVPSSYLLGLFQFITLPAVGLWCILVGAQLYRHSSQLALMDGTIPPGFAGDSHRAPT